MPYFKEYYRNNVLMAQVALSSTLREFVMDEAVLLTHRGSRSRSPVYDLVSDSVADPTTNYLSYINEKQYLRNLEERGLSQTNPLPDRGHTFELRKRVTSGTLITGAWSYRATSTSPLVSGQVINAFPDVIVGGRPIMFAAPAPGTGELEAFAQRAYSRAAPKNALFQGSRFIGELREGIPYIGTKSVEHLVDAVNFLNGHAAKHALKGAGEDTLNTLFGWLPLMSDAINLAKALYKITTGTVSTDSFNRPVHRSYKEPVVTTGGNSVYGATSAVCIRNTDLTSARVGRGATYDASSIGEVLNYRYSTTTSTRRWFEGAFTRFLPSGYDGSRFLDRANLLINGDWDPLTLWKLSPWSWLIDWYVDISTFLAAHQLGVDELLFSHYAYAMEETIDSQFLDWEVGASPAYFHSWNGPRNGAISTITTTKRRIRASPFGFTAGRSSPFSGFQATVLGALALTKLR